MNFLFYLMGKSAVGKDHIYQALLEDADLQLSPLVLYTTRPMRKGEQNGRAYWFVSEEELSRMRKAGKIVEERAYHTALGTWYYFTADDGRMDLAQRNYLGIGTLASFEKLRDYYGRERVMPLYIETDDDIRLMRAIKREKKQQNPNYVEVCRRFLADTEDFSEEKLQRAGVDRRFFNNGSLEDCVQEIRAAVRHQFSV